MKDERPREKETHIYVRVCVYIYRGTKKGALRAREGRKEMEELDQYPTTTGLSVEIRPSVRGPRCTILARYYPSWTREILRARRTGQTEREEETTRLDVAPYRLLSPHIYIYIYRFFHRLTSPGVTSGRDRGSSGRRNRENLISITTGEEYMDGDGRN